MDIRETKRALRKELRTICRNLDEAYMNEADAAICESLIGLPEYKSSTCVMCYLSMRGEPATAKLIDKMLADGKRVCIPLCTDVEEHIMVAKLYTGKEMLVAGAYGIMEPSAEAEDVAPEEIDFIVAPCVSCDRECRRLGHGAGYYDRFLPKTNGPIAALCYEKMMSEEVPIDEYDRLMDAVVTEKDIYRK